MLGEKNEKLTRIYDSIILKFSTRQFSRRRREEMTIIIIEVWQHLHIQLRQYLKSSVSKSREVLLLMQIWYLLSDNECDLCDEEFNCLLRFFIHQGFQYFYYTI